MEAIKDLSLKKKQTVNDLISQFSKMGGYSSVKLAKGRAIWNQMHREKCFNFLSFPSCLVAAGTRGIIKDLVKNKQVDAIVTTGGTLALDLIRTFKEFYSGDFGMDDVELHKEGYHRLGSILIKTEDYGPFFEDFITPLLNDLYKEKKEWGSVELAWECGKYIQHAKNKEDSILYWAWKNKIPMFVPGLTDGVFGSNLWMFWQKHKDFKLNLFEDEQRLCDIVFDAKKLGALVLGGGISKHHTIWWSTFVGGLDYAVYITTAPEYDGSLSGARTREAITWNKIKEKAKHITIEGDATVLLPLLVCE